MGGVANHVARLSGHWPEGGMTEWWVAAGAEEAARANPQWTVRLVPVDASGKNWPESGTLLVHYTQYGYAGGGIPWRLVRGLIKWRRAKGEGRKERRLAVFFHETWLEGPLWRRRGLAAPFARWCARALARSADVVVTNCGKHAAQLADVCAVTVLPVPANIEPGGEAARKTERRNDGTTADGGRRAETGTQERRKSVDGLTVGRNDGTAMVGALDNQITGLPILRPPNIRASGSPDRRPAGLRLVIFGLPETRLRTLRAHRFFISWLRGRGELGELVLLGAGEETHRFAVAGMRLAKELAGGAVRRVGEMDEAGVSAELTQADLGLSSYAEDEVGKSCTLAALFVHGCPVGCAGHDAGGLAFDLSPGADGSPRDWPAWLDAGARVKREALVAAYVAESLDWRVHAGRLAALAACAVRGG